MRLLEEPVLLSEGRKPFVFRLGRLGADLLADAHGRDLDELGCGPKSDNTEGAGFIDHLLATNDLRIAITVAASREGWLVVS